MSKGQELAKELGINCKQALYSAWGNFYAQITDYPCVLFDKSGFLLVNSANDLEIFEIKIGKRTNVPNLISSVPSYQLISAWRVKLAEEVSEEDVGGYIEGAAVKITVNRYERDRQARSKCIAHYGYECQACGIKLSQVYGSVAEQLIHVHHVTPISSVGTAYELDPIQDLRPLCPNCHAVAHLRKVPYSIEELQRMLSEHKGNG